MSARVSISVFRSTPFQKLKYNKRKKIIRNSLREAERKAVITISVIPRKLNDSLLFKNIFQIRQRCQSNFSLFGDDFRALQRFRFYRSVVNCNDRF